MSVSLICSLPKITTRLLNLTCLGKILLNESLRNLRKQGQKMLLSNTSYQFWDDCLDFKAYIRLHTTHNIFKLEGEVPEKSCLERWPILVQFEILAGMNWFILPKRPTCTWEIDWSISWCGPHHVAKIITPTGDVVHCSTYRLLTLEDLSNPVKQDCMTVYLRISVDRWDMSLCWVNLRK